MVGYTMSSLLLLAQPVVQETSSASASAAVSIPHSAGSAAVFAGLEETPHRGP
jgi:hypothetical protein